MKRIIYLLLIVVFIFIPVYGSQAQSEATAVASLAVDFWPDYDRTAVLVLMNGVLPAGTETPALVTLSLPENAEINAVAYTDAANGLMNADFQQTADQLVITTPTLDFHVEYYLPYEASGSQRSFTFNWTSQTSVNELTSRVQQPLSASNMIIEPAPTDVASGSDGFDYHLLPTQTIPAGQSFVVNVDYTMTSDELSINRLSGSTGGTIDLQPSGTVSTSGNATPGINWPVVAGAAGGVLILAALAFLYLGNRSRPRVRKPAPARASKPAPKKAGGSRFCHNCGEVLEVGDRFCRNCGTPVKGK